jgi:hypothetical protein
MLVLRDRGRWILDCLDPALYRDFAECLRSRGLPAITVFRLAQDDSPWRDGERRAYRQSVTETAQAHGLCVQKLFIHDRDVYAEFRAGGCTAPPQD